jgi:hypothetical protein
MRRMVLCVHPLWYYVSMYKKVAAFECRCDLCGHRWISEAKPIRCAKCKSRVWNCDAVPVENKAVVKMSRVPSLGVEKTAAQVSPVIKATGCKCGATGVMIVGGKKKCAACGRDLGA